MRFADLFAGLGGFHLAARKVGAECIFACEIDEGLRDLYERNFGIKPVGDIRQLKSEDVPVHDLLCAGFPCQAFSKAGEQTGLNDIERGSVVYNMLKIVRHHRPKYVLLENVAHFVAHDKGHTFEHVERDLQSIGYATSHEKLSPHQFGVPQIRERMFLVGRLGGLNGFAWPVPSTTLKDLDIKSVLDSKPKRARPLTKRVTDCLSVWQDFLDGCPRENELPSWPIWTMEFGADYPYTKGSLSEFRLPQLSKYRGSFGVPLAVGSRCEAIHLLPSHALNRSKREIFPDWKQRFIALNRDFYARNRAWIDPWIPKILPFPSSLQKLEWNIKGGERDIWKYVIQFRASGVRVKRRNSAPSLVAMTDTQVPIIAWKRRYMTTRECARLQSMESLKHLPEGELAVRALGNAVNVEVAELVLRNLLAS